MKPVAIVSGGGRGLGAGIVAALLTDGHRVATFSRSRSPFIEACIAADEAEDNFYSQSVEAADRNGGLTC